MIALNVTQIKYFMNQLLAGSCFDSFLLAEASISTYNTFVIDGHQNREFYSDEEWEDPALRPYPFSTWKQMRSLCFDLIKGKRTPVSFKLILHLMPEYMASLLEKADAAAAAGQLDAYVLTVKYDNRGETNTLTLTAGVSFKSFVMDKTPEHIWDQAVRAFLDKNNIPYEEL